MLAEYPLALERVLRLLATGGWATEYLLRHPIVLDELVDPRSQQFRDERVAEDADAMPGAAEPFWLPWIAQVDAQLQVASADVERQMDVLRDAHHAQVFRLLLADLGGHLRLEHLRRSPVRLGRCGADAGAARGRTQHRTGARSGRAIAATPGGHRLWQAWRARAGLRLGPRPDFCVRGSARARKPRSTMPPCARYSYVA